MNTTSAGSLDQLGRCSKANAANATKFLPRLLNNRLKMLEIQGNRPKEDAMEEHQPPPETPRKTGEKLWDATLKTLHSASFRAAQYKHIVQKKIDLNALHKKIAGLHGDLGRLVDDARGSAPEEILNQALVQDIFHQLDGLKHAAATLEEELAAIKAANPPDEDAG
jgi:hypothetical protein